MSNQVRIRGQITQLAELRYTPAGVPIRELEFTHQSTVTEGDYPKQLHFTMRAKIVGEHTEVDLQIGQEYEFVGFLAPMSAKSSQIRLHIQAIFNLHGS